RSEAPAAVVTAFRADDRIAKTLLLSALAPDVPALRDMTARRLAALNHGTVTSMIPGQEVAEVIRRIRSWASRVPELKVGHEDDPSVRLQLVGVDTGQILELVAHVDNDAAHRRLLRELLLGELGIHDDGAFELDHPIVWRGSRRTIEIVYGNVRDRSELRDEVFEPSAAGRWRLLLDYPFDSAHFSAAEDRNRLNELKERGARRCVAWLPGHVTRGVLTKIGTLVRIEYLLSGSRLDENATRLGADDRQRARDLLRNQGENLRAELRIVLKQAYGLAKTDDDNVLDWSNHLISLDPALTPKLDVGRSFPDALGALADQCFAATFPDHPRLDPERRGQPVSAAELRTVLAVVRRAIDADGGRTETDKPERPALAKLAHPLQLGEEHGGPFVLSRHWETEFERRAAGLGDDDLPVRQVRAWLGDLGLETRVENLVIATYAELSRRAWVRAGQIVDPPATVDEVRDDMVLRPQAMPDAPDWAVAVERAGILFGEDVDARVISPRSLARFARIGIRAEQLRAPAAELVAVLEELMPRLGAGSDEVAARRHTAEVGGRLLAALRRADGPAGLVSVLAGEAIDVPLVTLGRSLSSAAQVAQSLRNADWNVLDLLPTLQGDAAATIRRTLRTGAATNEDAAPMAKALRDARDGVLAVLAGLDDERRRRETEERARRDAEDRARRDAEDRVRREEDRVRREADELARREAAERARQEAAERADREERQRGTRVFGGTRSAVIRELEAAITGDAEVEVTLRMLSEGRMLSDGDR
ncbi:MAG: hypothetical protein L0H64_18515, partial [Pseudonocardia sp.]|nr:hypothetical protein [Pseudonocardia sp.]